MSLIDLENKQDFVWKDWNV